MAYDYQDGFTIGGEHSSSLNLIVLEKDVPLMPEIKNDTEEMDGQDGIYDFGLQYREKSISVTVRLLNTISKTEYNNTLRKIATILNPRLKAQQLIFDDEPDKMYFARLSETFNPKRLATISDIFTINFICYDPFTYSINLKKYNGASQITVNQEGGHVARPVIKITKGAGAGTIRNVHSDDTTEEIKFNALSPEGVYIIDCKEQTSLIDGSGAGAYEYLEEEKYFSLHPGSNVISKVSGAITRIDIEYRDTWL